MATDDPKTATVLVELIEGLLKLSRQAVQEREVMRLRGINDRKMSEQWADSAEKALARIAGGLEAMLPNR